VSEDVAKGKDVAKSPSADKSPTADKSPGAAKSPRAKARSRAKWIVLGVLIAAVFLAVKLGFVGYGWAHLMAKVFPRDESLLRWFPGDTAAVLIVDPHQIELGTLGSEQSVLRTGLERMRADIDKATDIDIARDVDKLAITSTLVAARGRFDFEGLTARLGALSYEQREHAGKMYLARTGEDAITVIDGVLLYGDEAAIKTGIDASGSDASLADNDKVTDRLSEMGWDHAVLVGMQFSDKPSIRSMISGSNGPRAITVGMRTVATSRPPLRARPRSSASSSASAARTRSSSSAHRWAMRWPRRSGRPSRTPRSRSTPRRAWSRSARIWPPRPSSRASVRWPPRARPASSTSRCASSSCWRRLGHRRRHRLRRDRHPPAAWRRVDLRSCRPGRRCGRAGWRGRRGRAPPCSVRRHRPPARRRESRRAPSRRAHGMR